MANEFIIRKGFTSNASSVISGSLQLTGSVTSNSFIKAGASSNDILAGDGTTFSRAGIVSGSSQLTSSYDTRYALSGSAGSLPSGLVSGSSQLTSSYDVRYALSSSGVTLPADSPGSFQIGISGSILTVTGNVELVAAVDTGFEQTLPPQSGIITLGTGSIGTIPKFTTQYEIADSVIVDNTTYVSLTGGAYFSGSFYGDGSNLSGVTSYTDTDTLAYINSINVISGSSQVSYVGLSNIPAGIVSGSTQITPLLPTGTVSGSSQVSFTTISNKPTLVSGSSQITYIGISSIPAGIVSGSVQIVPLLPTETVSGSAQIAIGSTTGTLAVNKGGTNQTTYTNGQLLIGNTTGNTLSKSTLTQGTGITITNGTGTITIAANYGGSGLVSGSSQVSYVGLSNIPAGIVSGSSQLNGSTFTNIIASGSFSGSFQGDGSNLTGITAGAGMTWNVITGNQNVSGSNGYITNSGTLLTVTLPNTNEIEVIRIVGKGVGGWKVNLPATFTLNFMDATATGSIASTDHRDSVEMLCLGDSTWQIISSVGNIEIN